MAGPFSPPPARPLRVLNLIDGLSGGGSERLLWNTIELSDPARVQHRVMTASPDWFGDFHYAPRLAAVGAYVSSSSRGIRLPSGLRRMLAGLREFMRRPSPKNPVFSGLRYSFQAATLAFTFPRSVVEVVRHRPDVVHTHTFYSFVHGVFLRLILRVPVVHTVPCLFAQMRDNGLGWLPRFYRWSGSSMSAYFTGASVAELQSVGIPSGRIVALSGGLDLGPVHAARHNLPARRAAARRRLGLPEDALIALNVGRLHASKGQAHALAAVALLAEEFPQLHLVILGEGEMRASLVAQAESLGIQERVHLAGFWEDPIEGCAAADIYLRTNLLEGDNLSSLQALALGVPVAGFATDREIDVVRTVGAGRLAPVGNAAALAASLRELLTDREQSMALGQSGAAYIDANLGIENLLQAYTATYENIGPRSVSPASKAKPVAFWVGKILVTVGVMVFVLTRLVDWPDLSRAATTFPLSALVLMLGLHLIMRWVMAWQTALILTYAGVPFRTARVFQLHLISSFFSFVLPGEVAGATVSWHLFSRNSGRGAQTAAALIYLRLVGLFMLVLVGAIGLCFEPRLIALHAHWAVLLMGIGVGLPLFSFHSRRFARGLKGFSDAFTQRLPFTRLKSVSASFWTSVSEFSSLTFRTRSAIWAAAVMIYLLNVAAGLVAMSGAEVHAPATAIIWLLAVVTLISLVPFTLAGFGVRELGVAALLKRWYEVPTESAVLFSLALGVISIIASAGFGGIAVLSEVLARRKEPAAGKSSAS